MRPTHGYSGQHLSRARRIVAGCFASSESTARTRTSNGSRAALFLPLFVRRSLTLRRSALDRCRTKYPSASSPLMASMQCHGWLL